MSNNNKDATSTLQSVIDTASSTAQSTIGSITGNPADKAQAQDKRDLASAESDLSHSAVKAGPFTANASGGVAKDDHDRTASSWNQNVGAAKEALGGFIGAEGLKREGQQQNKEGRAQEAQGQISDLGKGISDRVGGTVGLAVAGLTGNEASKTEAQRQHDEGKARQRGVEADLQKQADA